MKKIPQRSGNRESWLRSPTLITGLWLCGLLVALAVLAPWLVRHDPSALGVDAATLQGPSTAHPLGTDVLGRDVLSRLIFGCRVSLLIGWLSVAVGLLIGVSVGLAAGLGPRWLDRVLMLVTDAFMAFPQIFLILFLVSLTQPSVGLIILVLGLAGWMPVARLVRAETLSLREREFVAAVRGLGLGEMQVAWRHVLPNVMPTILVAATLRVGNAILAESFLSFLGLGVQDPHISWGLMVQQGRDHLLDGWWLAVFPGLAITLTVVGYNLLGDGLRRRFDPRGNGGGGHV